MAHKKYKNVKRRDMNTFSNVAKVKKWLKKFSYSVANPVKNQTLFVKRSTRTVNGYSQIQNSNVGDAFWAFKFQLDDLPNYAEFSALFDNYQIKCVVMKFIPVQNQINIGSTAAFEVPVVGWALDYDDATAPTTMDALRQYATYKEQRANKGFTVKIYPKVSMAAYAGGISSGYLRPTSSLQKMLIADCANPSIEHYGLKVGITDTNATTGAVTYDIHATYYLKFKGII